MQQKQTRTRVMHVRLSDAEHARLTEFCRELGLTPSEALRRLAREAGGSGPRFEGETRAAVLAYAKELRAIGVNINQIARVLNSGRAPGEDRLRAGLGRLSQALVQQEQDYLALCAKVRRRAQLLADAA